MYLKILFQFQFEQYSLFLVLLELTVALKLERKGKYNSKT